MLKKIRSFVVRRAVMYLSSHLKIKSFIKKCVHSHIFIEKVVYIMIDTNNKNKKNARNDLVCSKRAKKVYIELKKGLS